MLDLVASLVIDRPRRVLELGAGTGDLTLGLSTRVDSIDAVEISGPMLEIARQRHAQAGALGNVRWIHSSAEDHAMDGPYAGIVAAESIHWMDWESLFPALEGALSSRGVLIIVANRVLTALPWQARLRALIARYSTTQDVKPYEIGQELEHRGLFVELGRQELTAPGFEQSLDDYAESFHSRNGFSRQRMGSTADEFDDQLRSLVLEYAPSGRVAAETATTVIWGRPRSGAGR